MAANADDRLEIIGFSQPSQNSAGQWQPPPRKHCIAQVTGGLGEIYAKVESGWQSENEDYSKCINEDNFFHPNSKGVLMAGRYQVIRVLGRGNSSTILQAQDTFRPGLYEVAIKVLKPEYYRLGYQESHLIAELNKADIHNFCGVVKLLNTFTMGSFFCMTFELLRPWPLHQVFKKIADKAEKLVLIRKVALRMLQILGFLGQQNVIHADLKPENILCNSENISDGIKVIDFGNAIHGVYEELSLYYDEFELQTLLYRAPEVLLGLPFGQEIDMWSLGCILAELYQGKPLFWAKEKKDLLTQMTSLFGPLPTKVYQRAKFFTHFKESVGQPSSFMDNFSKFGARLGCIDFKFVSFLQGLLTFDPGERMSVSEAIQHPFMAPEMAVKYVLPFKINGSEASGTYSPVDLTPSMYTHAPAGTQDPRNKHLTSVELLHHGTRDSSSTIKQKVVHVVAPFEPGKSKATVESVAIKVEPKSEPCGDGVQHGDEKHEGLELTDAPTEVIEKPVMKPAPVAMKDVAKVIESSSSMDQHPPGPVLREDTSTRSKQSLKTEEKPLKSQQDSQGNTVRNLHHSEGKHGLISKNRELKNSPEDGHSTPHQTLKDTEDLVAKSKSSPSKERTLALDAKSEDIPGNPTDSGPNFSYLNQQRLEAVSHRNKSLGVNVKKLQKSPHNIPQRCASSNPQRIRIRTKGKSKSTPDVRKNESPSDRKGMLIYDAKKSVHSKKDVTLLVAKDQKKMMPKATTKGKSENLSKGHSQKTSPSNVEHELMKHSVENTSCRSPIDDTAKHEKRTSEYDFKVTPEKTGQRHRSRKRSLQRTGDSMVKRSKTKRVPSGKVMKNPPMDSHVDRSEMCILEALHSNGHSSDIEQSEARLSSSSETSQEQATLASKISRLQARGDNTTAKQFIPSPPVTPSSSSSAQPVSLQSCKTWFLESSPLADQPTRTVVTSERSDGAGLSQEHSPRRQKMKHKAKWVPSSPSSPSSSLSSQFLSLQPSSSSLTSHSLTSKFETKSNHHPTKHSSPALRIMQLFSGSSSSSSSSSSRFPSSVRQQTVASPNVQSQRTDIKATETEPQDQLSEEEEDEVLLL